MRRLKKKIYYNLCGATLVVLGIVRACNPGVMAEKGTEATGEVRSSAQTVVTRQDSVSPAPENVNQPTVPLEPATRFPQSETSAPVCHRIRGVYSYDKCFPDVQDVQIVAARRWGVRPVRNRAQAEERKNELVYVGSNPYFVIDKGMTRSIPYLVPRAAHLLQDISRNFLDSLYLKGKPLHRLIVTSVLRSEADVELLRQENGNASPESCHRFGTTFDIAYNRYNTVCPPGEQRREVGSDTLMWVLSEVLRDLREQKRCYVKYEKKQGCFHITTR